MSTKLKEVTKDRFDRRVVRKKTKAAKEKAAAAKDGDDIIMEPAEPLASSSSGDAPKYAAGEELKDESVYREQELKELEALIHPDVKADTGANVSGLYELVGAYYVVFSLCTP